MATRKEQIYYELLVLRCRRQDRSAQEELIHAWEKRLFYYLRRLLDDEEDAWDALQETWLSVLRGIGSIKDPTTLATWLYRIARNKAMDRLRRKCSERELLADDAELPDVAAPEEIAALHSAEEIHHAMEKLSLPHREVLTLFFLEDMSIEEMSSVLQTPPGTVKSRLHYARSALREILEREAQLQ